MICICIQYIYCKTHNICESSTCNYWIAFVVDLWTTLESSTSSVKKVIVRRTCRVRGTFGFKLMEHLASTLILVVCARAIGYFTKLWSCEKESTVLSTLQMTWRIWVWLTHTHNPLPNSWWNPFGLICSNSLVYLTFHFATHHQHFSKAV